MTDLSRRSFFAALAGAPVAAAASAHASHTPPNLFHVLSLLSPEQVRLIKRAWADGYRGSTLRTLVLDQDVVFTGSLDVLFDSDSRAIDSMINEGGRDWA